MAKKKTRVTLPGSLSDLVRDLQNGGNGNATINNNVEDDHNNARNASEEERRQNQVAQEQQSQNQGDKVAEDHPETTYTPVENRSNGNARPIGGNHAILREGQEAQNALGDRKSDNQEEGNRPIGNAAEAPRNYSPGRPVKQNTMKEYHIVKDDSKDSWDLFLDMAKQYKEGGGKLATIYIDGTLKNILDRMKYVGPEKLPTSAILSSIVARFIYDHEDEIRKALFSGNLF